MTNSMMEAKFTLTRNVTNQKVWVVGDKGKGNTDYFAKQLKAGESAKGDAVIVDTNMNGKIDKDDTAYRSSNLTDTTVDIGQNDVKFQTTGLGKLKNGPKQMTALNLFKQLTGKQSTEKMKHYSIEGENMKSIFERKAFEPIKRYVDPNPAT